MSNGYITGGEDMLALDAAPPIPMPRALPWSAEINELYVDAVWRAWNDLLVPKFADEALDWFVTGLPVDLPKGTVSLVDVWDVSQVKLAAAARARYDSVLRFAIVKGGRR